MVSDLTRAMLVLACIASPALAQDALLGVGPTTQVSDIEFEFRGPHAFEAKDLKRVIATSERGGLVWLRNALGFLPFVSRVGEHPLDPLDLQRDVVRLRHFYDRAGLLAAEVDYRVRYDAEKDRAEVTFTIEEGPPLLLRSLEFVGPDSGPPGLPADLAADWDRFVELQHQLRGRFGEVDRRGLAERTIRWLRNHGYPFPGAEANALVDTAANRVDVTVVLRPGVRAKVREFAVNGNEVVPDDHLTRQLPLEPGEWYDASRLEEGRRQITQFPIIRLALLNVPRESVRDSTVAVQLRVTENPRRLVRGEAGLTSSGGLTSQVEWANRGFLGGLRSLTVAVTAQTGVVALESPAERRYRLALTAFQPYVGDRRLSVAGGPFAEYRDDVRDRSQAVGFEGTLVLADNPLRSVALGLTVSHREILDFGFGDDLRPSQYLPLLGLADSVTVGTLGTIHNRSVVTLDGSWGELDQFANPREGYVVRPRVSVTLPGFNTSEYLVLDLGATGFLPVTDRIGLTVRGSAGRIIPFGRSVGNAGQESPFVSLLRLREVTFTAGGTRDVRGWGSQLLGPKLPQVRLEDEGGATPTADRYVPIGGLARTFGSAELQLPFPGFGDKWQTFLFLDGARVWTPDRRFSLDAGELDQDRFFLGTGIGVGYETVVGAVQVALGYKLNPSALDVRDPDDVLAALREGRSLGTVPGDSRRRLQLHFSIGATF